MKSQKIELNSEFSVDYEKLISTRLLIQANSGGGKSWCIRRLLEQSHEYGQQIIIDIEGEFSTLREKFDYVLVGKDGDTPATIQSASLLARKLMELRISAIIDLSELQHQDRKKYLRLFLQSMIDAPKELWLTDSPCLVVIDEAHQFAPEKGESEAASAVIDLCTRGRKRGLCAVLATQRISKLAKDAAAECNNKLIGRASQDIDMKRASDELGFTSKTDMLSLRSLKSGEFYAFGPAMSDVPTAIKVGDVSTSHPTVGSRASVRVIPPRAAIKSVLAKLADLPQEAKQQAQTVEELKSEIVELKRLLRQIPQKIVENDPKVIQNAISAAVKARDEVWNKIVQDWKKHYFNLNDSWKRAVQEPSMTSHPIEKPIGTIDVYKTDYSKIVPPLQELLKVPHPRTAQEADGMPEAHKGLGMCEKKIYSFLMSQPNRSFSKTQIGIATVYSPNSGGFNNALGKLNTLGMIERNGTLIHVGHHVGPTVELEDLFMDEWSKKLGKCEAEIFNVLRSNPNESFSKEEIAAQTPSQYSPTSGGFNNSIGALNSLGLTVRENGRLRINPELLEI